MLLNDARLSAAASLVAGQRVPVDAMPFVEAMRVQVNGTGTNVWDAQIIASARGAVRAGDVLMLSLFVRGSSPANETGEARATAYLQRNNGDFVKLISVPVAVGGDWRRFLVPSRTELTTPTGQHQVFIHMAYFAQTIEIGGL